MFSSYWFKTVVLLLVSYFPGVGMYIVIPAAVATNLNYLSVVGWGGFGAFAPTLTVVFFYERLVLNSQLEKVIHRFTSTRLQKWAKKYGVWFLLFLAPFTGTWVTSVTAKVVRMDDREIVLVSAISIMLFAAVQGGLVLLGVRFIPESATPIWLQNLL